LNYESLYIGGVFIKFQNVKTLTKRKALLFKTFQRRFWYLYKPILLCVAKVSTTRLRGVVFNLFHAATRIAAQFNLL